MQTDMITAWTQVLNQHNPDKLTREIITEKYTKPKSNFFSTISSDLVTVQPMSAPSGLLFYVETKYGNPDSLTRTVITEKYLTKTRYVTITDACGFRID